VLTATGRTLFVPSIGLSWVLAALISSVSRPVAILAVLLLLGANATLARERVASWNVAAGLTAAAAARVDAALAGDAPATIERSDDAQGGPADGNERSICLVGLPDHYRHAYAFRNAFPAMGEVLWPGQSVVAGAWSPGCEVLNLAVAGDC
jgi:hypothetical protein